MVVLHNNKKGNNYLVAKLIAEKLGCLALAAEDNPDISESGVVIFVISNTGDEELPQPMENYLLNLTVTEKEYVVCELGNYFGFENYCGCKKVVFGILEALKWKKISDISLDSLPKLDVASLEAWLQQLTKIKTFHHFVK